MGWKSLYALILRAPLCGANNVLNHDYTIYYRDCPKIGVSSFTVDSLPQKTTNIMVDEDCEEGGVR